MAFGCCKQRIAGVEVARQLGLNVDKETTNKIAQSFRNLLYF